MEEFWRQADESKLNAQYSSDSKLEFLKQASLRDVRKICLQYRYFVHNYPNNLSELVGKLPYGKLKSLLAQILAEELGSGQEREAHIVWYDRFLQSIGVEPSEFADGLYEENGKLLKEIERLCREKSFEFAIGLVGMGGECLCQIYLTNMHKYLRENAFLDEISAQINWDFWTFHVGEEDVAHRLLVRKAIGDMALDARGVEELTDGYMWGKSSWDEFWTNNYKETRMN